MQHFTYLLINFFTIIICFVYSFDRRIQFHKHFITFLKSSIIVAIPFIIWDIYFTKTGVWWFNADYLIGLTLVNLPIEEILFFICIPFSCVFTYFCLSKFFDLNWANAFNSIIVFISLISCAVIGLLHLDKIYTCSTAFLTVFTLIYMFFIRQKKWIGEVSFVYSLLMLGFFPVNGILTGTGLEKPIVNYNPHDFLGIRILTIPIEDAVYGYNLFIWNLYFFKKWRK